MQDIRYSKICPNCGKIVYYKTIGSYYANKNKQSLCRRCKGIAHSEILKGRIRPPFTKDWRRHISESHKNSKIWKNSMNTPEYKEKHRQKMLRLIRENKSKVRYNPKACEIFDFLNKKLGWNGHHAKNEMEKSVDIFFLDYYEPSLNIAIEWDEKHHNKSYHRKRDGFKSKIILETINCEFYRIDETKRVVRKIDHCNIDRTEQLQQVINEYYEK